MQKIISVLVSLLMVASIFSGCKSKDTEIVDNAVNGTVSSSTEIVKPSGTASATVKGYGGDVTVTLTIVEGNITECSAVGDNETKGIGSKAIDILPDRIVENNNLVADTIAGATHTSNAVIKAAEQAYADITGGADAKAGLKMKPGTYTAEEIGFSKAEPLKVKVTVSETEIEKIEVEADNGETQPIFQSVIDLMIPRMLENQTIEVDAIVGATATSNGIRSAVRSAVIQAITEGGSDIAAISELEKEIPKKKDSQTIDTDILVVGMGGTGTAAAMRAVQVIDEAGSGLKVLAIDKAGKYGGTSAITTEALAVNAPGIMEKYNNGQEFFHKEDLRGVWLEYTEGDAKTELVDLFLNNSGNTIDWLENLGFKFSDPKRGFTEADIYEVKHQYLPNDISSDKTIVGGYYDSLYSEYKKLGGEYMLETEAYELLYNADNSTVTGVKARGVDGTEYTINAGAVILCTGGFAGSAEMEEQYLSNEHYPLKGNWMQFGMTQNDGKMIQSAIDIGAGTYNMSVPPVVHMAGTTGFLTSYPRNRIEGKIGYITGRTQIWSVGDLPLNLVVSPYSLAVTANGERFTSETGVAMLDPWIAGPYFYSVYSAEQLEEIKEKGLQDTFAGPATEFLGNQTPIPGGTPIPEVFDIMEDAMKSGFVTKADTISELAELLGMTPETLENTVKQYNSYCESGNDKDYGKPADFLEAIGEGPYYAVHAASYCYSTCGGLDINEKFEVLKQDGTTPVNGLYAAGTDSIGVLFTEKKPYVTFGGAAQGWAYTSGYLAGEQAVSNLAGN